MKSISRLEDLTSQSSDFSGRVASRFVESKGITRSNKILLKQLAKAIEHPNVDSSYTARQAALAASLGIAGLVQGCGAMELYPKGANPIISGYGSMTTGVTNLRRSSPHNAIDIGGSNGDAILASADGVVVRSMWRTYGGNVILIEHGQDADGNYLMTGYAHNARNLVQYGEKVKRGQKIAEMGDSGLGSGHVTHLHFEVLISPSPGGAGNSEAEWSSKWKYNDPEKFWYNGPDKITCFDSSMSYGNAPVRLTYPVECKK